MMTFINLLIEKNCKNFNKKNFPLNNLYSLPFLSFIDCINATEKCMMCEINHGSKFNYPPPHALHS